MEQNGKWQIVRIIIIRNCPSLATVSLRLSGLNEYQRILGSGTVYWALIGQKSPTRLLIGQDDQYPVYLGS